MRGRDKFAKAKKLIGLLTAFYKLFPKGMRSRMLIRHRRTRGNRGLVIRYALLKTLAAGVGDNVLINTDVYLFNVKNLKIGDNVSIHPMCYIEAVGGIDIGNDVSIAHGTSIISVNHGYEDPDMPIKDQKMTFGRITVEDNVWIGAKATLLSGVTVGGGSIVAAGAVVTHDVEKNSIVGGVPAKKIKARIPE